MLPWVKNTQSHDADEGSLAGVVVAAAAEAAATVAAAVIINRTF